MTQTGNAGSCVVQVSGSAADWVGMRLRPLAAHSRGMKRRIAGVRRVRNAHSSGSQSLGLDREHRRLDLVGGPALTLDYLQPRLQRVFRAKLWRPGRSRGVGWGTIGASVFGKDITERKKAESELRTAEADLSALIESTRDLVWSVDLDY